jgi:hypothetical protein
MQEVRNFWYLNLGVCVVRLQYQRAGEEEVFGTLDSILVSTPLRKGNLAS